MIKILLLITAVSVDGFVSAAGISGAGIKIPLRSAALISLVGTIFLGAAVLFADTVSVWLSEDLCGLISSGVLIFLGIFNLFHGLLKRHTTENGTRSDAVRLYFDGTAADADCSKSISCGEALLLAAALSADSAVTGIGAGLSGIALLPLLGLSFGIGLLAVLGGAYIGRHLIFTGNLNLQWIGGVLLIILAVLK